MVHRPPPIAHRPPLPQRQRPKAPTPSHRPGGRTFAASRQPDPATPHAAPRSRGSQTIRVPSMSRVHAVTALTGAALLLLAGLLRPASAQAPPAPHAAIDAAFPAGGQRG